MSMVSSLNDPQRPESLHTADSLTEVTAVESSTGSGSTLLVAPKENSSSLNDGTGSNGLANGSASEVESYITAPTTTLPEPVLGDIDADLDESEKRWNAIRLSELAQKDDPDLVASKQYLNELSESLDFKFSQLIFLHHFSAFFKIYKIL